MMIVLSTLRLYGLVTVLPIILPISAGIAKPH